MAVWHCVIFVKTVSRETICMDIRAEIMCMVTNETQLYIRPIVCIHRDDKNCL